MRGNNPLEKAAHSAHVSSRFTQKGRPRVVLSEAHAAEVRESLEDLGSQGGVATLKHLHPMVTRRNLKCLLAEYREAYIKEHGLVTEELEWPEAGVVWTMDHTKLSVPAAAGERYALSVRDFGCGCQLLWTPVESPDAVSTMRLLLELFLKHGAPLVLKSDNGSAFIAWLTETLLKWWNVVHLLSPPRRPGYNGVVEVGMQWLKPWTQHAARRAGHGGDRRIADLLHLDPDTVAKGRRGLLTQDVERERVRRKGGGRKPLEKKRPK